MKRFSVLLIVGLGIVGLCGAQAPDSAQFGIFRQEGVASWYGVEFGGRPTASGEIFTPSQLTAAHPTLPFGTMLKVTNKHNNRSVIVRVNDRGPFVSARIIDLSQGAAEQLDIVSTGTAPVIVESVEAVALPRTNTGRPARPPTQEILSPPAAPVPRASSAPRPQTNQRQDAIRDLEAQAVPPQPRASATVPPTPSPVVSAPASVAPPVQSPVVADAFAGQPVQQAPAEAPVAQPAAQAPVAQPVQPAPEPQPVAQAPQQVAQPVQPAPQPVAQAAQPAPAPQPVAQVAAAPVPVQGPAIQQTPAPTPAVIIPAIPPAGTGKVYRVQVGAFKVPRHAVEAFDRLKSAGLNPAYERNGEVYRVVLSGISADDIEAVAGTLGNAGFKEAIIREEL